jgi:hypothetical protein
VRLGEEHQPCSSKPTTCHVQSIVSSVPLPDLTSDEVEPKLALPGIECLEQRLGVVEVGRSEALEKPALDLRIDRGPVVSS